MGNLDWTAVKLHVQFFPTEGQPNLPHISSWHVLAAHYVAVTDTSLQVLAGIPVCHKLFSDVSTDSRALLEDRDGHVRASLVEVVMSAFLREQKVSSQCSSRVRSAMCLVHPCVYRGAAGFCACLRRAVH